MKKMNDNQVFIAGNFPSFKNSKQYVGKGRLIMSKTVQKYLRQFEYQWKTIPYQFANENYPLLVGFHFVRGTRHKFDFHNMVQGCADLMVKYGWIKDDSMDYFIPFPILSLENGEYYSYNKENPGVIIKILNNE